MHLPLNVIKGSTFENVFRLSGSSAHARVPSSRGPLSLCTRIITCVCVCDYVCISVCACHYIWISSCTCVCVYVCAYFLTRSRWLTSYDPRHGTSYDPRHRNFCSHQTTLPHAYIHSHTHALPTPAVLPPVFSIQ